jgi:hypothetical protein
MNATPEEDRSENISGLERDYQEEWIPWDSDNQMPDVTADQDEE